MHRRDFLQTGMLGCVGTWAGLRPNISQVGVQEFREMASALHGEAPKDEYQVPDWLQYARSVYFDGYSPPLYPRLRNFDASRLVQIVTNLGGNLLRFQPIGYWAYYPSKAFRVHPELGNRDLIDEVTREARRAGIHCYCYTGYGHPHMKVGWVDQHPEYADWVLRDPEGKPYGTYVHYGDVVQRVCLTGEVYRAKIRDVVRELCEHDIDGVYFDAPSAFGYSGICFCDSCRNGYRHFSGMDLDRLASLSRLNGLPFEWNGDFPRDVDIDALAAWYTWAVSLVKEDLFYFRKIIHGRGKFMLCHNAQAWTGTSLEAQYRIPDGFMIESSREIYGRLMVGLMGASMARPYKKVAQMYLGSYAVTWFGEPPHEYPPDVTHSTSLEDGDEILMEGFADLACGNVPLYATANRLYFQLGSGSTSQIREVFEFMKRSESVMKNSVPVPFMTIVPTWESQQLWREKKKSWNWPMMSSAMGLAMLDARIAFDVNPSTEMTEEWLREQKVIALCGASGLSDEEAERLAAWVELGGGLLATYDTGLYDAAGRLRRDGGALREVLGVTLNGEPLSSQPECYYRIKERHPALGAHEAGDIVQGDGSLIPITTVGEATVLAECWNLGTDDVRGPAIVANRYGKGRTIYIAGSLEGNYLYDRVQSTVRLLSSMVEFLANGASQAFRLEAPPGVYGVARQTSTGEPLLWLLANVGFKDAAAGRMRQHFLPVGNVHVSVRIPFQLPTS